MGFPSWLRIGSHTGKQRRQRRRRAFYRPCLEVLEQRQAPAVLTVNTATDETTADNFLSLREAINVVNSESTNGLSQDELNLVNQTELLGSEDTIVFDPGLNGQTITLNGSQLSLTRNVKVTGLGADQLMISGNNSSRVLEVDPSVTVTLSGLTIANGGGRDEGGGIENSGTLTVINCTLSHNSAGEGGGIENSGKLTVTGCTLSDNSGELDGGGIANFSGSGMTVSDCIFSGNSTGEDGDGGGGIFSTFGSVVVSNSTFSDNLNTGDDALGGGICNEGTLTLTNCTFSGNRDTAFAGGGIANFGQMTVTNCALRNNSAPFGGGISNSRQMTVSNCTLWNNSASNWGGGIYNDGTLALTDSTLSGNSASVTGEGGGGGIFNATSELRPVVLRVANTLIAGNTTAGSGPDINGAVTSLGYNLIGNPSGASGLIGTDLLGVNPQLGPLQDNGGPVPTMALLPDSPAIDAGSDALAVDASGQAVPTDQRGFARIANDTVDIGAFEVQMYQVYSTADSGGGSLRNALTNANRAGGSVIFFTTGGTINLASALPDISRSVQILGPGADDLTIQRSYAPSTPAFRIFTVDSPTGATPDVTVTVSGLSIANGQAEFGGGIYANVGSVLTLTNCSVSDNSASVGGGIFGNVATLTVTACTLSGNAAAAGGIGFGGGIDSFFGRTTVIDSTVANNSADSGGGIANADGVMTVTNCTLTGNSAPGPFFGGGGLYTDNQTAGSLSLANTIIAGNTSATQGPDVSGPVTSLGYNLIGDQSGGSGFVASDLLGVKPLLAPLGNYGGPTQTMALLPGSPAINAGSNALAVDASGSPLATDQRGLNRYAQGTVDIGAFESRGFLLGVAGGNNQQTLVNNTFASPLSVIVSSPFGEPVQGGVVTATAPGTGPSANFPRGNTAAVTAAGQAVVAVSANGSPGTYGVTVSARGAAPATFNLMNLAMITLGPGSLPHATAGVAYSQTLTAGGGAGGPYTFAVTAGVLPTGLFLSPGGVLSGTSTKAATYSFTVTARDHSGFMGSHPFQVTVDPGAATHFAITGPSSISAGTAFSISVTALDAYGNVATGYLGMVKFASSDGGAALPGKYTFLASDSGVHTFTGLLLHKKGTQTITVFDASNKLILGTISIVL